MLSLETPDFGVFPAVLMLTSDGGVIATEAPGPYESAGMGSWTATGPHAADYTFYFLYGGADNRLTSKGKVVGKVLYDPGKDCWDGPWKIEVVDAEGKLTYTTKGTHTAKCIAVESL